MRKTFSRSMQKVKVCFKELQNNMALICPKHFRQYHLEGTRTHERFLVDVRKDKNTDSEKS